MKMPARILDLHTHLFNARYVPLSSIIANAMKKDESILANYVARLLEALTGSSYSDQEVSIRPHFQNREEADEYRIEQVWNIAKHELLAATGSMNAMFFGEGALQGYSLDASVFDRLRSCELMLIIQDLSHVDYASEGWAGTLPLWYKEPAPHRSLPTTTSFGDLLEWARGVVKKSLRVVTALMNEDAWGETVNYLSFFLTMMNSEEEMLRDLFASYGNGLPPLQVTHYMMDMQMAYPLHKAPHYSFHPAQVDCMQSLQRTNPTRVFGFSAFDPRHDDWLTRAEYSLAKGFIGFKFYPAMGYKPTGNEIPDIQERIDSFFDFCVNRDIAVFAHCTPKGFQTRSNMGNNAHPKYWREILATPRWNGLRLCLGHAGGGRMANDEIRSPGWMAESADEWEDEDNFARIVTELCATYPNVYCDVGYITALLQKDKLQFFVDNLERARKAALEANRPFDLLEKIAYGSDWHMPDMVNNTREYLETFLEIMNRLEYQSHLDRFFWQNAYQFLKLTT